MQPYGPLIETRLRVVTWNIWGTEGQWRERTRAIAGLLAERDADIAAVQEVAEDQLALLPAPHRAFSAGDPTGVAVLSRWPIRAHERLPLSEHPDACLRADIAGPRGEIHVFAVILDWRPHRSDVRKRQIADLIAHTRRTNRDEITIICGDFNTGPDSDEIRMLTGRAASADATAGAKGATAGATAKGPAGANVFWYDAWEIAGNGPGITWSNANPWAAPALMPERRIDYVFSAWPRTGGAGHPLHAELVGDRDPPHDYLSDHLGVLAEIRY